MPIHLFLSLGGGNFKKKKKKKKEEKGKKGGKFQARLVSNLRCNSLV